PGESRSRWIDDDDIWLAAALAQFAQSLPDVAREEGGVADAVQVRIFERAGNRLFGHIDAPHGERVACQHEPDRADAAVEVVHRLVAGERSELARDPVQAFRH